MAFLRFAQVLLAIVGIAVILLWLIAVLNCAGIVQITLIHNIADLPGLTNIFMAPASAKFNVFAVLHMDIKLTIKGAFGIVSGAVLLFAGLYEKMSAKRNYLYIVAALEFLNLAFFLSG